MNVECPHGIVVGTCMWCLAGALEYESKAIESIRRANYEREQAEAKKRVEDRRRSEEM